jgi:hypothetical protein
VAHRTFARASEWRREFAAFAQVGLWHFPTPLILIRSPGLKTLGLESRCHLRPGEKLDEGPRRFE